MTESTKKYKLKERLIYPYPKTERQKHSNRIFPSIYHATYPRLQTEFPQHFRAQRNMRYSFEECKKDVKRKMDALLFTFTADGGRQIKNILSCQGLCRKEMS